MRKNEHLTGGIWAKGLSFFDRLADVNLRKNENFFAFKGDMIFEVLFWKQ